MQATATRLLMSSTPPLSRFHLTVSKPAAEPARLHGKFLSQVFLIQVFLTQVFLTQVFLTQVFLTQVFLTQVFLTKDFLTGLAGSGGATHSHDGRPSIRSIHSNHNQGET